MQKKWLNILSGKLGLGRKKKGFVLNEKYRVDHAFTVGGRDYYQFANQMEAPALRQMAALGMYDELECRCDKKFLVDYCDAVEKMLSEPKINLQKLALLTRYLKERLDLVPLPEFIYKLASVVYFDKDEPLYDYDYAYNEAKIKFWKEHGGSLDFFSKTQLAELMPPLGMRMEDIKIYSGLVRRIDTIHQQLVSDILSDKA